MPLSKYLEELQEMIAKFMDIHNNPYDTSKHNEKADKLIQLQKALAAAKTAVKSTKKTTKQSVKK